MPTSKPSQFAQRRVASRSCLPDNRGVRQVLQKGVSHRLRFVAAFACMWLLSLCLGTPVQPQSLSTIPGLTPPEAAMAVAIENLCRPLADERRQKGSGAFTPPQNDLIDRCGEMVRNGTFQKNPTETRDALLKVASEEVATLGTNSVETGRVQLASIGARLAALRGGATGISLQGLAFNIDGKTLPGSMLANLLPFGESQDVASVDGSGVFGKFKAAQNGKAFPRIRLASPLSQPDNRAAAGDNRPNPLERLGVFVSGTLSIGDKDTTAKEAGFDFDTLGVTAGIDYRLTDAFVLGGAFGFGSTDADIDPSGGGGDLNAKMYNFSIYGTYYIKDLYIDGIMSFGWNTYDSTRNILYSLPTVDAAGNPTGVTTVNQIASGDARGTSFSPGIGAGYDFRRAGFTYGPYARLSYLRVDIDGYQETIAGTGPGVGLALEFDDQTVESLTTALGGQISYAVSTQLGVLVPQLLVEWAHEFLDNSRPTTARYVNDPNKVPILITTDNADGDFFNLGLSLSAVFRGGKAAFLYYQTALGLKDVTKHDILLGIRLAF